MSNNNKYKIRVVGRSNNKNVQIKINQNTEGTESK